MPRLKGSKNKKKRTVRLKLPDSTLAILIKLSEDVGLPLATVHNHAVLEGATELRSEVYEKLIEFNKHPGEIIRERELIEPSQESQETAPVESFTPAADSAGHDDAQFRPGFEAAPQENSGMVAGDEQPDWRAARRRALEMGTQEQSLEEFRQRAMQTAQHIANHPPFTMPEPISESESEAEPG